MLKNVPIGTTVGDNNVHGPAFWPQVVAKFSNVVAWPSELATKTSVFGNASPESVSK